MRKVIASLLIITGVSFAAKENPKLQRLLAIIQGSFNDKVYTISMQKAKEYLQIAPKDDKYREKVAKIYAYSYIKAKKDLKGLIDFAEKSNLSKETKKYIYKLILSNTKNPELKKLALKKLYQLTGDKKYLIALADFLYKQKNWGELVKLTDTKETSLYKLIALYKLKRYKDVIAYTDKMAKFPIKEKDQVLYYRGLAFLKTGKIKKGVDTLEAISFKTPEIINYLATYYLKSKNYIYAERYFKILSLEPKYRDYSYFYLGYIYEKTNEPKKAYQMYKKLLNTKGRYRLLAMQRLLLLKAKYKGLPKEDFYTVRIVLYKKPETAERFIKKHKLQECFVYPYKKFSGVFCGVFLNKDEAKQEREKLQKQLKIKDMVIQKLKL